jgi:hypothetical protein
MNLIPKLSDSELTWFQTIWSRSYLILNVTDSECIWFLSIWFQADLIPNQSDSKPFWFHNNLIPNHSDSETIWNQTNLIANQSDSKLIWFWTNLIPNLSDTEPIWYRIRLISNKQKQTKKPRQPLHSIQMDHFSSRARIACKVWLPFCYTSRNISDASRSGMGCSGFRRCYKLWLFASLANYFDMCV